MATQIKPEYPAGTNEEEFESDHEEAADEEEDEPQPEDNVSRILKQLQSTGALIKKPKQEYRCVTCDEEFSSWGPLENHLLQHVSLPSVLLEKLPSDDEIDTDEDWSDEEPEPPAQPQKIEISELLKNKGLHIKTPIKPTNVNALDKLSGLGFTIKKNTPVKEEKEPNDLMQKLGSLGGLKLKLKSEGGNNSFKVVNGLKDFKASDDEGSGDERHSGSEKADSADEAQNESGDEADNAPLVQKTPVPVPKLIPKSETAKVAQPPSAPSPPARRPAVKQTPKRGANLPIGLKIREISPSEPQTTPEPEEPQRTSVDSNGSRTMENVVVKQEKEQAADQGQAVPLFSGQVKTERTSPPPEPVPATTTPLLATVKTEANVTPTQNSQPLFTPSTPLPPVKKETESMTVIEINGDSNDEDDDCCVVSSTPAPDVKPVVPKTEAIIAPNYSMPPAAPFASTPSYTSAEPLPGMPSTEKQHSFNWNAPDSKPPIDSLEKSADDIFESLLSSGTKKENSMAGDNEYISIDRLGSQYSCDVCNMRFTNSHLFEEHIRMTGHSKSIIAPTSSLMPYQPSNSLMASHAPNSILASLLPVKHLADQVGKIGGGAAGAFTHQQNVMINIQAYPGAGGMMPPPQPQYGQGYPGQNMPPGYPAQPQPNMNNMYGPQGAVPGQYPGQYVGQQGYQQYPGQQQNPYQQMPPPQQQHQHQQQYQSPLQGMQQAVYSQAPAPPNSMGPPQFVPSSSPGAMKPPPAPVATSGSGIRIQNVQTFSPGQGPQPAPGQTVRMAPPRPRMQVPVRGVRPSVRPGLQVRGAKPGPRMSLKRPGGPPSAPQQKRRPDMLLPGRHDNEDCHVMAMQKQREGMPMIHSVQGAKDKLNLGSQISITKKPPVNREANAMANVLASRGISIKQKQRSRSPTPERPLPHIPNLGAGVSIKHTSKSSSFNIPEAKVGGGGFACRICKKMFMSQSSLGVHMANAHPQSKFPQFKCEECPASYPKQLQLQHHRRVFHNVAGPNRELGLPVVDLSQEENLQKLSSLGIYSFIPLANREQASGCFGIPVISVHNMQNGITNSLQALGADGLLSLGPLKPLPNT